ncbi:MAG: alanine racemase [Atribacterota bacterium]|nr:alanine racemase [Atribacterota bacterium]
MYPRLEINLEIIRSNVITLLERCQQWHLRPVFVTKGFLADFPLVKMLYETGVRNFADSNLVNLLRIRTLFGRSVRLSLIRLPMRGELEAIRDHDIIPFVSHWGVLQDMNAVAQKKREKQKVILAVESGDAREGFLSDELLLIGEKMQKLPWIEIEGIGSTLACLNGVLPGPAVMRWLIELKEKLRERLGGQKISLSVGGTTFMELWENEGNWEGIDEIRFGEAFLFGSDISRKRTMDWLKQGAFIVWAEIVEVYSKGIARESLRGFDAFGETVSVPVFGQRKRALLALGKQDIDENQLYFPGTGVKIVGATSNYLVVDIEESRENYRVGDVVGFRAGYGAVLRAFLSPYVVKVYVKEGEGVKDEEKFQRKTFSGSG